MMSGVVDLRSRTLTYRPFCRVHTLEVEGNDDDGCVGMCEGGAGGGGRTVARVHVLVKVGKDAHLPRQLARALAERPAFLYWLLMTLINCSFINEPRQLLS